MHYSFGSLPVKCCWLENLPDSFQAQKMAENLRKVPVASASASLQLSGRSIGVGELVNGRNGVRDADGWIATASHKDTELPQIHQIRLSVSPTVLRYTPPGSKARF